MSKSKKPEERQVHCNKCGQETKHLVLHTESKSHSEEVQPGIEVSGWDNYRLVTCGGCGSVALEHVSGNSEDWDPMEGYNEVKEYFPPRTYRPLPMWIRLSQIPDFLEALLLEIYKAVQNGMPRVAMMGIRALLEAIMIEKVGDQGRFIDNLKAFETAGFISGAQRKVLDAALDAGHAAMHRRYVPKDAELITCMDVAEHVVQAVYVLPETTKRLVTAVPKRRRLKKSPATKP